MQPHHHQTQPFFKGMRIFVLFPLKIESTLETIIANLCKSFNSQSLDCTELCTTKFQKDRENNFFQGHGRKLQNSKNSANHVVVLLGIDLIFFVGWNCNLGRTGRSDQRHFWMVYHRMFLLQNHWIISSTRFNFEKNPLKTMNTIS